METKNATFRNLKTKRKQKHTKFIGKNVIFKNLKIL